MLDIYTVSFFGHRFINNYNKISNKLYDLIYELLNTKQYVDFLVGKNGDFDMLVSSCIRSAQKRVGEGNSSHILVLPYETAEYLKNEENYLNYYDEVEISANAGRCYYKAALLIRNYEMIDRSNLVVCYVEEKYGGAYKAMQYAKKLGKKIINIAEAFLEC